MHDRPNRRVVVVANRGPFRLRGTGHERHWVRSTGGLVTALDPVLRERGGVWVAAREAEEHALEHGPEVSYEVPSVDLPEAVQRGFYLGVSNDVLWPLLHSLPPTLRVGEAPWEAYEAANRAFAEVALRHSTEEDLVWVHDYHLMRVPALLRAERPRARIGWFCHVPWPAPDLYRILPSRRALLDGLLGADLLGFHTEEYARYFLDCVARLTDYPVDPARMTVRLGERVVRVRVTPIGIPVREAEARASQPRVQALAERLREGVGRRRILLGVDRLDYTKGIVERLLAYERFLHADETRRERFVLVQVAVPSRSDVSAYRRLQREVAELVGDINGRYSTTGRVAIHYLFQELDPATLYAHYRAAEVCLVTPLRDGMNLVAHEFCAAHTESDGVLVLSEFAGAAEYLREALLVNAYDLSDIAHAMERAVTLSEAERNERMRALRARVAELDVHRWADDFLELLERSRR